VAPACVAAVAGTGLSLAWIGARLLHGKAIPWFGVFYNVPILLAFLTLGAEILFSAWRLPRVAFLTRYRAILAVWAVGAALLYLRLVTRSIDVSGHAAWSVLMLAHAAALEAPVWLLAGLLVVLAQVIALKWLVLGGDSGAYGLLAGLLLALGLWLLRRGQVQRHQ